MFPPVVKRKYRPSRCKAVEDIYSRVSNALAIAARIRKRAKELGRSHASILKEAGLGPSFIKDLDQNPKASPRTDSLMKIAKVLDVTLEWLAEGREVTPHLDDRFSNAPYPEDSPNRNAMRAADMVDVPEYDVQISAGPGALVSEEPVRRYWGLPRAFLEMLRLDARQTGFVEITGDSMIPSLYPGDLVLIDLRAKHPGLGAIYALWDGDATVCKHVESIPESDPPKLRIISANKAYSTYEVPAEWANVIGRVAWFGRRT
jgi:phage repressor protein C with HTH and peptisase S24 domain